MAGSSPSAKEMELRDQVDAALTVLRMSVPDQARFNIYFRQLLSLTQAGLVGESANPELALRALASLKQDVTAREAGRIKNQYMKSLGLTAAGFILGLVALLAVLRCAGVGIGPPIHLLIFEIGVMAGVWLSFGTRKPVLKFEDLNVLEEDRLEPAVRLLFAGLLSLVLALAFHLKVITITLGDITSERLSANGYVALLFGLLSGVSEKALSTNVSKQASALFTK